MDSIASLPVRSLATCTSTEQAYGIVLGCPRSGTTYLSRLLKTIPEFECMIGTLLPVAVPHVVNQPISRTVYNALAVGFERSLDAYLHSGRYHSRAMAVQKWFNAPTGLRGLYDAVFRPRGQPARMIYKEPVLAFAPEFVLDAFPDGKILHIYRDGRDCAHSLVRTYDVLTDEKLRNPLSTEARMGRPYDDRFIPWWVEEARDEEFIRSTPYVRAIWMWSYMVRRCYDAFADPEPASRSHIMQVRYEDLVREPRKYGYAIVDFFGGKPTRTLDRLLDDAYTASIGKHKARKPAEIADAERIAGTELDRYGYT
jgi:hypothetical protein